MKAGPDIAMVASLVGDPARANMLTALMTGKALTPTELAHQAGITPQTASSHLSKLEAGGLVEQEKQGRHRYFRLTDPDVAGQMIVANPRPAQRRILWPGAHPHVAGDLGVQMLDSMKQQRLVRQSGQALHTGRRG